MAALAHSPALPQAAAVAAAAVAAKAAEKNIRDRAGQAAAALPDDRARAAIAFLFPGGRSAAGASAIGSNLFVGFGCGLPAVFFGSFSGRSVALGPRADADTRLNWLTCLFFLMKWRMPPMRMIYFACRVICNG